MGYIQVILKLQCVINSTEYFLLHFLLNGSRVYLHHQINIAHSYKTHYFSQKNSLYNILYNNTGPASTIQIV